MLMALGPRGAASAGLVALLLFSTLSAYIPELVLMGMSLVMIDDGLGGFDSMAFLAAWLELNPESCRRRPPAGPPEGPEGGKRWLRASED